MSNRKKRESGIGIIGMILLIPVLLIAAAVAWYGYCEARKAYWDQQVKLMCERDGGVKIYERVPLPQRYVDTDGLIRIPFEANVKPDDDYFIRTIRTPLVEGYLSVSKHQTHLIRAKDRKLLAEAVSYGRGGGDFPTFAHPSYVSCQANVNIIDSMNQNAFNQ